MIASSTPFVEIAVEPDFGPRNRATVFFRLLLALPVLIVVSLLAGNAAFTWEQTKDGWDLSDSGSAGSAIVLGVALLIVFAGKYPSWLLTFTHGLQSFEVRVATYLLLLRDEYPAVDHRDYAAVLYPEIEGGARLNRFLPLIKWFLAIPHYLWLAITGIGVFVITLLAWVAILITGRYPRGSAGFVVGWLRYYNRVIGYAWTLVTDRYPAFSLR